MRKHPYLHVMPRVGRDIESCVRFVGQQPRGKPNNRKLDIRRGIEQARSRPESNRVGVSRPSTGIELRRCNVAQFVIVYAYLRPGADHPYGVVSIRAVRHLRFRDVFRV